MKQSSLLNFKFSPVTPAVADATAALNMVKQREKEAIVNAKRIADDVERLENQKKAVKERRRALVLQNNRNEASVAIVEESLIDLLVDGIDTTTSLPPAKRFKKRERRPVLWKDMVEYYLDCNRRLAMLRQAFVEECSAKSDEQLRKKMYKWCDDHAKNRELCAIRRPPVYGNSIEFSNECS